MSHDGHENEELNPELVRSLFDTFLRDRCICQYCGFDGSRSPQDWVQLQGDHLIPRHIAGEHANDPLNRVTTCYYCNSVKRQFDPTHGQFMKVSNSEVRQQLIEITRAEIEKRKSKTWAYGKGLKSSYEFMIRRLQS